MSLTLEYDRRSARLLLYGLVALECAFVAAYVLIHIVAPEQAWGPLRPFFDLDSERSVPTWFSVLQLFCIGALLLIMAQNHGLDRRLSATALTIAGVVFIALSADEGIELHENLTYQVRRTRLAEIAIIGQWSAWIVAYALVGLVGLALAWSQLRALWRHFRPVASAGFAGAAIFVLGAVGFEIAGYPFRGSADTEKLELAMTAIEEFLEMLGVSLMLYATLLLANGLVAPHGEIAPSRKAEAARPSGVAADQF